MDDLGYGDISNFGAINYKTPNIDNMVNEGMSLQIFILRKQFVVLPEQDF